MWLRPRTCLLLASAIALAPDELSCEDLWSLALSPEHGPSRGSHRVLDASGSAPSSCASAAAMRAFLLDTWPFLVLPRYWEAPLSDGAAADDLLAQLGAQPVGEGGDRRYLACEHSVPLCRRFRRALLSRGDGGRAAKLLDDGERGARRRRLVGRLARDVPPDTSIKALVYLSTSGPATPPSRARAGRARGRAGRRPRWPPPSGRPAVAAHLRRHPRAYAVELRAPRGTVILFRTDVLHRGGQLARGAPNPPRLAVTNYYQSQHAPAHTAAPTAAPTAARRVFVDLGANWGNTLRLYEDLTDARRDDLPPGTPWHVFGFEAAR